MSNTPYYPHRPRDTVSKDVSPRLPAFALPFQSVNPLHENLAPPPNLDSRQIPIEHAPRGRLRPSASFQDLRFPSLKRKFPPSLGVLSSDSKVDGSKPVTSIHPFSAYSFRPVPQSTSRQGGPSSDLQARRSLSTLLRFDNLPLTSEPALHSPIKLTSSSDWMNSHRLQSAQLSDQRPSSHLAIPSTERARRVSDPGLLPPIRFTFRNQNNEARELERVLSFRSTVLTSPKRAIHQRRPSLPLPIKDEYETNSDDFIHQRHRSPSSDSVSTSNSDVLEDIENVDERADGIQIMIESPYGGVMSFSTDSGSFSDGPELLDDPKLANSLASLALAPIGTPPPSYSPREPDAIISSPLQVHDDAPILVRHDCAPEDESFEENNSVALGSSEDEVSDGSDYHESIVEASVVNMTPGVLASRLMLGNKERETASVRSWEDSMPRNKYATPKERGPLAAPLRPEVSDLSTASKSRLSSRLPLRRVPAPLRPSSVVEKSGCSAVFSSIPRSSTLPSLSAIPVRRKEVQVPFGLIAPSSPKAPRSSPFTSPTSTTFSDAEGPKTIKSHRSPTISSMQKARSKVTTPGSFHDLSIARTPLQSLSPQHLNSACLFAAGPLEEGASFDSNSSTPRPKEGHQQPVSHAGVSRPYTTSHFDIDINPSFIRPKRKVKFFDRRVTFPGGHSLEECAKVYADVSGLLGPEQLRLFRQCIFKFDDKLISTEVLLSEVKYLLKTSALRRVTVMPNDEKVKEAEDLYKRFAEVVAMDLVVDENGRAT